MKSHTDLPQSKKLAEFLPFESADMCFNTRNNMPPLMTPYSRFKEFYDIEPTPAFLIPCWSLGALISIIPQELFDGEYIINITEGCDNKWILTYDHHENRSHSYYGLSTSADNLVDACTDIIIKLKERNII